MKLTSLFSLLVALAASPSLAQDCIPYTSDPSELPGTFVVRYTADWSDFDHFNSKGVRLQSAAAVLQQDRANVHKFGKSTAFDSRDGYFVNLQRRQLLGSAEVTAFCGLSSNVVRRAVVNGTVSGTVMFYRAWDGRYVAAVDLAG
ncbi:hypothetical protein [Maritimibacter sp. UBA3975]|uniref:hypothetical protein n=1 Tax=Maritimibacter sp. UBA3975 TaxID=1946833 RepID=UPI000C0AE833|nr:hypothetical protein [Maritimibacter sp. UBA3975]MAM60771.1 hypothetical protein [Maritimibacter sp.]